jgi:hypothetical protein
MCRYVGQLLQDTPVRQPEFAAHLEDKATKYERPFETPADQFGRQLQYRLAGSKNLPSLALAMALRTHFLVAK